MIIGKLASPSDFDKNFGKYWKVQISQVPSIPIGTVFYYKNQGRKILNLRLLESFEENIAIGSKILKNSLLRKDLSLFTRTPVDMNGTLLTEQQEEITIQKIHPEDLTKIAILDKDNKELYTLVQCSEDDNCKDLFKE